MPVGYLTIKEGLVVENQRRHGLLKRRDARLVFSLGAGLRYRKMNRIDVNKSGRIFDFLVSQGMLPLAYDPVATRLAAQQVKEAPQVAEIHPDSLKVNGVNGVNGVHGVQVNGFHPNGGSM